MDEILPEELLARERDAADRLRASAKAPATARAYDADFAHYAAWCRDRGLTALPATPDTVATYLSALAGGTAQGVAQTRGEARWSLATIRRRRTTIGRAHRLAGLPDPCVDIAVQDTLRGMRRTRGEDATPKEPVSVELLRRGLEVFGDGPHDRRDRALVLLGFGSAMRRAELASLDLADVVLGDAGVALRLRWSKTGPREVGVPRGGPDLDPVVALRAWLRVRGDAPGPLFLVVRGEEVRHARMHPQQVMVAVRRVIDHVGLDADAFAGHSLRSGFATSAARAGANLVDIMHQLGHSDPRTTAKYMHKGKLFDNPARELLR